MSGWNCKECGLSNSQYATQCIACFTYNHDKYWECKSCGILNKTNTSRCIACYTINAPVFKISDKWNKQYLKIAKHMVQCCYQAKLISWNNKLYTIVVSYTTPDFTVKMLDHSYKNIANREQIRTAIDHQVCWQVSYTSYCLNQKKGELYIILDAEIAGTHPDYATLVGDDHDNFEDGIKLRYKLIFIVFDLNTRKKKIQREIHFNDPKFSPLGIKNLCLINNDKLIAKNKNNETSYHIANYWLRTDISNSDIFGFGFLSRDLCLLINKFYAFSYKPNSLQLIIFTEETVDQTWDNSRDTNSKQLCAIHHSMIDLNEISTNEDESKLELNIINTKTTYEATWHSAEVEHIFSILIGYELYMTFMNGTWKIDLNNGVISKTNHSFIPYKNPLPQGFGCGRFKIAYDSIGCLDCDKRYSFFLMENPDITGRRGRNFRSPPCDLLCFDKVNKGFFELINSENMNTKFQKEFMDIFPRGHDFDIIYFKNNELIISGKEYQSRFMYKTRLTMNKIQ